MKELNIPRNIEVLIKKAAVDPDFREKLVDRRAAAANDIELKLEPSEITILNWIPEDQLKAIIAKTEVPEEHHSVFRGKVAALMLAAVGVVGLTGGCFGHLADPVPVDPESPVAAADAETKPAPEATKPKPTTSTEEKYQRLTKGIRPDRPKKK